MLAEGTSSSTLDQALGTNGLPNGASHSTGRHEHPFSATPSQPQQQALCLLFGGFTGGGVDGTLLALDPGRHPEGSSLCRTYYTGATSCQRDSMRSTHMHSAELGCNMSSISCRINLQQLAFCHGLCRHQ